MKPILSSLAVLAIACAVMPAKAADGRGTPAPFACPYSKNVAPHKVAYDVRIKVYNELVRRFDDAFGPHPEGYGDTKVAAEVSAKRIDDRKMAALAEVSGCAALFDADGACAQYYDPELGDPLSVIMSMKKKAVLRRQFEDAIEHLERLDYKRAAQSCIKLVGVK